MQLRANHLTISRIVLLPIPCALIFGGMVERLVGLGMFIALGATDWYDGKLARQQGPTVLGGLLDPVADKMFLAFTYLPMARIEGEWGSGVPVAPLWMVCVIFFRDLVITSIRSITATHDIEFHTSTLAKFKTAIQMGAGAFVMWAVIFHGNHPMQIAGFAGATAVIVIFAVVKAFRRRPVGLMVWTQVGTYAAALATMIFLRTSHALLTLVAFVTGVTVISGIQYMARVLRGLAEAAWPARPGEVILALAEALAPVAAVSLFAISSVPAWASIAMLTAELGAGGLDNLLATEKVRRRRWLAWIRCLALFGAAGAGWYGALALPQGPLPARAAMAAAAISGVYAGAMFDVHRMV